MALPKLSGPLVFAGFTALFLVGFVASVGDMEDYLLPAVSFLVLTALFAAATVRLIWPGRARPLVSLAPEPPSTGDG